HPALHVFRAGAGYLSLGGGVTPHRAPGAQCASGDSGFPPSWIRGGFRIMANGAKCRVAGQLLASPIRSWVVRAFQKRAASFFTKLGGRFIACREIFRTRTQHSRLAL